MTNTYFNSKEQYLQFRKDFAAAANAGILRAEHFIFLNIVRGLPYHRGFSPCTNKNKLINGANIWQGLDDGVSRLLRIIRNASEAKKKANTATHTQPDSTKSPITGEFFNPTHTDILCLSESLLREHKKYYTNFREGAIMAQKIIRGDIKPQNYQEFIAILEEINNA